MWNARILGNYEYALLNIWWEMYTGRHLLDFSNEHSWTYMEIVIFST